METTTIQPNNNKNIINEKTFLVWLLIVASIMLFVGFSSAMWVHKEDGIKNNVWTYFTIPVQFWVSTGIVIVSSIFMQLAYKAAKKDDVYKIPSLLTFTLILGIAFTISQIFAYNELVKMGLTIINKQAGDISASFLWVFSLTHLLHILGGIILLIVAIVKSSRLQIHKKNLVFINICKTYWHFLGILWIYLIIFIYFAV